MTDQKLEILEAKLDVKRQEIVDAWKQMFSIIQVLRMLEHPKKPMGRPFGYTCHDDTTVCDGEKCDHPDHKGQVRRWVNIDD